MWKIIKDLKSMPTHEDGGVQLSVDEGRVLFASGDSKIHAEHGMYIPYNDDPPTGVEIKETPKEYRARALRERIQQDEIESQEEFDNREYVKIEKDVDFDWDIDSTEINNTFAKERAEATSKPRRIEVKEEEASALGLFRTNNPKEFYVVQNLHSPGWKLIAPDGSAQNISSSVARQYKAFDNNGKEI